MAGFYDSKDYSSLSEKVYRSLRDGIAEGKYRTGDCLVEMKIAEELGVSRTPCAKRSSSSSWKTSWPPTRTAASW
jgi:hypothetical protein